MKFRRIYILFVLILMFSGCGKEAPTTGSLQFNILDDIGNPAVNATVSLYNSQNDYTNNSNLVVSGVSDNNGVVLFSNLSPITFYYYIGRNSDCANNDFTSFFTSSPVSAGNTTNVSAIINETGSINFNNVSSDPYFVYVNGNLWGTVNGKSTGTAVEKLGAYTIHIKQASGYVNIPTEEDFNTIVKDCSVGDVNFP